MEAGEQKPPTFKDITTFIKKDQNALTKSKEKFREMLKLFVKANETPSSSPHFKSAIPDRIEHMSRLLKASEIEEDANLILLLLKTLKTLSRRADNRHKVDAELIKAVLLHVRDPINLRIAAEGANVILNICYERENVLRALKCNVLPPLVGFLTDADLDLQANAAGAIQSICFQSKGRKAVLESGAIPTIITLMDSRHDKVLTRSVGAIHNLSSDAESIRVIRRSDGIPRLVSLLRNESLTVAGSAAGALQNVSREVASRLLIREMDTCAPLADLLSCDDLQAQVCAAGALLNIMGPELESDYGTEAGPELRRKFGRMMSLTMSLAMVFDGMFDGRPQLSVV